MARLTHPHQYEGAFVPKTLLKDCKVYIDGQWTKHHGILVEQEIEVTTFGDRFRHFLRGQGGSKVAKLISSAENVSAWGIPAVVCTENGNWTWHVTAARIEQSYGNPITVHIDAICADKDDFGSSHDANINRNRKFAEQNAPEYAKETLKQLYILDDLLPPDKEAVIKVVIDEENKPEFELQVKEKPK